MKTSQLAALTVLVLVGATTTLAHAQKAEGTPPPAEMAAPEPQPPQWTGLPFSSLADYEQLIPIGMTRRDLLRALGQPEAITPGMGSDRAYHYVYQLSDGSTLRAVIIVRDGAVFIRRLYQSTSDGATARVN